MQPEIEVKFLNVDHDALRTTLREIGATCEKPMQRMTRKTFDFPDNRLNKERNGWVRVRDEGDKTTMSYKQLKSREVDGTYEVCLTVDNFAAAESFLHELGIVPKSFQETKRESWRLDNLEIELDEWPWTKPYMEVEGPDETALKAFASKLSLDWNKAVFGSVEVVYQAEYDVTDEEIDSISEFTFDMQVPAWLEKRRKV